MGEWFSKKDDGFYYCTALFLILAFILSIAYNSSIDERMAKLGHKQKVEIVQTTKEVIVWDKGEMK